MRFTPLGRRLLATVFELVLEIEHDFAALLPVGEFTRVQEGLHTIADEIDPEGAFGVGDMAPGHATHQRKRARPATTT